MLSFRAKENLTHGLEKAKNIAAITVSVVS